MLDTAAVLDSLSRKRPVFHSEADFQHALAWELHSVEPNAQVRLEFRPPGVDGVCLDIWINSGHEQVAIELKYVTRRLSVEDAGEPYSLSNHSAQDQRRYDFVKDLNRLEQVVRAVPGTTGVAIFLTNDPAYWSVAPAGKQIDAAFRIHEDCYLQGELCWASNASKGTTKNREAQICLKDSYHVGWNEYSSMGGNAGHFRYLKLDVQPTVPGI